MTTLTLGGWTETWEAVRGKGREWGSKTNDVGLGFHGSYCLHSVQEEEAQRDGVTGA